MSTGPWLKLIGRPGYVDDVVQDVFIQAHRGMGKLRDLEAVRPWLRRIAVRARARRWLRKRWVLRWFRELDVDAQTDSVDASASPQERAQVARIYRSLERLPEDERLVRVLRLVEGETLESIAEDARLLGVHRTAAAARGAGGDGELQRLRPPRPATNASRLPGLATGWHARAEPSGCWAPCTSVSPGAVERGARRSPQRAWPRRW